MNTRFIGLAGLGLLGQGISLCLQNHGFHVVALDPAAAVADSALFTLARAPKELAQCEVVIESITENLAAKEALFDELELWVGADVPIATNTSAIPISLLQTTRKYPKRFAGMHWAPPAHLTSFMEIIRGEQTDEATIQKIVDLSLALEKEPGIVQKDVPGFVANRLAYAIYREAIHMLEEGVADLATIDLLCKNSLGLWAPICGPFRWMDVTGGPALYADVMERIIPTLNREAGLSETMREKQAARGSFYEYEGGEFAEWRRKLRLG